MATITKSYSNEIVIQADNTLKPVVITNWKDGQATYGSDWVQLNIGNKGFKFSSNWAKSALGELTTINGVDVSGFTNANKVALINSNVLTEDRFSGNPTILTGATGATGQFTAIYFNEDSELDVTGTGTETIWLNGVGTPISLASYSGKIQPKGSTLYGKFSAVYLASGTATCYSNL